MQQALASYTSTSMQGEGMPDDNTNQVIDLLSEDEDGACVASIGQGVQVQGQQVASSVCM